MPCETYFKPKQTKLERAVEVKKSLSRLEKALTEGRVKAKIGPQGALVFDGWPRDEDRGGVSDACAYRMLTAQNSWALRQAVAKAETLAGRKVDAKQVAAGVHSHDGGKTWGKD